MTRYSSLRWILLAAGVMAIIGLAGMNVYSLYKLHESTIKVDRQPRKLQVQEFTDKVRYRFYRPFWGLSATDMDQLQAQFSKNNQFTNEVSKRVHQASDDSLYSSIYFIPAGSKACQQNKAVLKYSAGKKRFIHQSTYPDTVCSGMGKARSQMQAMLEGFQYNNEIFFDTNKSATIAFVDPSEHAIFGYLVMPLSQRYLTDSYFPKRLTEQFGKGQQSGMHVWLRDWTNDTVIASSHPGIPFDRNKIQFKQSFTDFFGNWKLEVSFTDTPTIKASSATLTRNLIVLGVALLLLLWALIFMFSSAQQERALAERQADFLANVTHELKTPLSVMQAAGENLSDGRVDNRERVQNYGNHIYNEAVRLRTMIEKLLDVAKADAGESLIEPKPISINTIAADYIEEHRDYIESNGFTLDTAVPDNMPMAMVDKDNFETILSNLVQNAFKYSRQDKYIGIFLDTQNGNIRLRVKDRGIGMSGKVQSRIFEKFYRAEDTLTAKTNGHGLGLSIVKNLVELNGGSISVKSKRKKGSTFQVTFPILVDSPAEESGKQLSPSTSHVQSVPLTQ